MNRPPLVVCRGLVVPRLGPLSAGSWSAWSRPADIGAITDPLRKGPEIDGQVGGSAEDHEETAVRMALA
jgi:hypothetical protein